MKNLLLLAAAVLGLSLPFNAIAENAPLRLVKSKAAVHRKADTRADNEHIIFGYCQDMGTTIGVSQANVKLGAAICVPAATAASWGESQLTKVNLGIGTNGNKTVNIFITKTLGATPEYTQEVNIQTESWNEISLNTPYNITGEEFYIGYEITTRTGNDYPIAIDGIATAEKNGGYIAVNGSWANYASQYGSVCIQGIIEGDNLPKNDIAIYDGMDVSHYVGVNTPFKARAMVANNGANAINSIKTKVSIDGVEIENATASLEPAILNPGEIGFLTIEGISCSQTGSDLKLEITIERVNGVEDPNMSNNTVSETIDCVTKTYPRKFVVEEWTGNWCGWCVYGIVAMKYMNQNYGDDRFIGIAIHGGNNTEPMRITSYNALINKYASGYPGCIINRTIQATPMYEELDWYYQATENEQTFANVEISDVDYSTLDEQYITVTAGTDFSINKSNAKYRLAFVITEDNVGPYVQTNYFSGGANGEMDGWEKLGKSVSTIYNEVARIIETCLGIANSLPAEITADSRYSYTASVSTKEVADINNCHIIALLLDAETGEIVNAAKIGVQEEAAVERVDTDNENAPVKYYNLQGIEIKNPTQGQILIQTQGSSSKKVIFNNK